MGREFDRPEERDADEQRVTIGSVVQRGDHRHVSDLQQFTTPLARLGRVQHGDNLLGPIADQVGRGLGGSWIGIALGEDHDAPIHD